MQFCGAHDYPRCSHGRTQGGSGWALAHPNPGPPETPPGHPASVVPTSQLLRRSDRFWRQQLNNTTSCSCLCLAAIPGGQRAGDFLQAAACAAVPNARRLACAAVPSARHGPLAASCFCPSPNSGGRLAVYRVR
jgi:hypothetical protein